jgi:nicotinamide mononucleotide (NMN) deamidase PncC
MRHAAYTLAVISTLLLPRFGLALEANEVFRRADPSVVVIVAEWEKRSEDRLVSGVLVEPLEIITNCRSVDGAVKLVAKQGSVQRTAKLRYQDAARDLCQIRLDDAFPSGKPVSSYVYSKDLEVGQPVFAIGSPRGLEHTISRGIISALREMKEEAGNLVQTDAAISPGSSGGGLFDSEGRLVGIITFGFKDAQNLNFALPSEWVQDLPKRNRDRLANIDTAKSAGGAAKPESESPDAAASGLPRVGDRWKYKLIDGKQTVGTVVVEITDVRGKTVTERITREGQKGFLAERSVSVAVEFNPLKFEDVVTLPGGYQLTEIAPYVPLGLDMKAGQRWQGLPVTAMLPWYGKKKFMTDARVAGREKVRVPAGVFDTMRVQATGEENFGTSIVKINLNYWYSVDSMRTVKMSLETKNSLSSNQQNTESYELVSFEAGR